MRSSVSARERRPEFPVCLGQRRSEQRRAPGGRSPVRGAEACRYLLGRGLAAGLGAAFRAGSDNGRRAGAWLQAGVPWRVAEKAADDGALGKWHVGVKRRVGALQGLPAGAGVPRPAGAWASSDVFEGLPFPGQPDGLAGPGSVGVGLVNERCRCAPVRWAAPASIHIRARCRSRSSHARQWQRPAH